MQAISHVAANPDNLVRALMLCREMIGSASLNLFEANPEAATVCRDHAAAIVEQFEACGLIQKAKRR